MSNSNLTETEIKQRIKVVEDYLDSVGAREVINGEMMYNIQVLSAYEHIFKQYQIYLAMLGRKVT